MNGVVMNILHFSTVKILIYLLLIQCLNILAMKQGNTKIYLVCIWKSVIYLLKEVMDLVDFLIMEFMMLMVVIFLLINVLMMVLIFIVVLLVMFHILQVMGVDIMG